MAKAERDISCILKDVFELSTGQVVVIVESIDFEIPSKAILQAGELVTVVSGVDYPRRLVDLPDGSRGLDFSIIALTVKTGSKNDWLQYRGGKVKISTEIS